MIAYQVNEIESEAGWGSRVEDRYFFPTEELARAFVKAYNDKHNNKKSTPPWYIMQEYQGEVTVTKEEYAIRSYKGNLVEMPKMIQDLVEEKVENSTGSSSEEFTPLTDEEKIEFLKLWLGGAKIQYKLGGKLSGNGEWQNFAKGAIQYIQRSDITLRETPKQITVDGIVFESMGDVTTYINKSYDLNV